MVAAFRDSLGPRLILPWIRQNGFDSSVGRIVCYRGNCCDDGLHALNCVNRENQDVKLSAVRLHLRQFVKRVRVLSLTWRVRLVRRVHPVRRDPQDPRDPREPREPREPRLCRVRRVYLLPIRRSS